MDDVKSNYGRGILAFFFVVSSLFHIPVFPSVWTFRFGNFVFGMSECLWAIRVLHLDKKLLQWNITLRQLCSLSGFVWQMVWLHHLAVQIGNNIRSICNRSHSPIAALVDFVWNVVEVEISGKQEDPASSFLRSDAILWYFYFKYEIQTPSIDIVVGTEITCRYISKYTIREQFKENILHLYVKASFTTLTVIPVIQGNLIVRFPGADVCQIHALS